jgi:hypothetical protein
MIFFSPPLIWRTSTNLVGWLIITKSELGADFLRVVYTWFGINSERGGPRAKATHTIWHRGAVKSEEKLKKIEKSTP